MLPVSLAGILEGLLTLATANLVTHFMEHHMSRHSLHFNDYRSEIQ